MCTDTRSCAAASPAIAEGARPAAAHSAASAIVLNIVLERKLFIAATLLSAAASSLPCGIANETQCSHALAATLCDARVNAVHEMRRHLDVYLRRSVSWLTFTIRDFHANAAPECGLVCPRAAFAIRNDRHGRPFRVRPRTRAAPARRQSSRRAPPARGCSRSRSLRVVRRQAVRDRTTPVRAPRSRLHRAGLPPG